MVTVFRIDTAKDGDWIAKGSFFFTSPLLAVLLQVREPPQRVRVVHLAEHVLRQPQAAVLAVHLVALQLLAGGEEAPVAEPDLDAVLADLLGRGALEEHEVRAVHQLVLVRQEEGPDGRVVVARLELQVAHPVREVHAHVGELGQRGAQTLHAPLERAQVAPHELQPRVAPQHRVPRLDLRLVRGVVLVQVHVVLRVLLEVVAVVVHRHLLHGQPAVPRLAAVPDQRHPTVAQVAEDRVEERVADHQEGAVLPPLLHADVLPHLHPVCPGGQVGLDALDRLLDPPRLLEALHGEGRAPLDAAVARGAGQPLLLRDVRPLVEGDVGVDGHDAVEAHLGGRLAERGALDVVVRVRVDLLEAPEAVELAVAHHARQLGLLRLQVPRQRLQPALCLHVAARHFLCVVGGGGAAVRVQ
eukprot:Rhum_TRINITY_DN4547_c0_g1::Rhum_TRINITY_DN4547_c0_g1_i1::g.14773::m.14773